MNNIWDKKNKMHLYYRFGLQYITSKIKLLQQHEKVFVMFHHLWRWRLNVPRNYTRPRCCSYKLICIIKKDQSAIKNVSTTPIYFTNHSLVFIIYSLNRRKKNTKCWKKCDWSIRLVIKEFSKQLYDPISLCFAIGLNFVQIQDIFFRVIYSITHKISLMKG